MNITHWNILDSGSRGHWEWLPGYKNLLKELLMSWIDELTLAMAGPGFSTRDRKTAGALKRFFSQNTSEEVGGFTAQACIQASWFSDRDREGVGTRMCRHQYLLWHKFIFLRWEILAPGIPLARILTVSVEYLSVSLRRGAAEGIVASQHPTGF